MFRIFLDHSEANLRPERNGGNGLIPSGTARAQKKTEKGKPRRSSDAAPTQRRGPVPDRSAISET